MYPQLDFFGIQIYTFGLALSISFILFFFMLYRLSLKYGINANFFLGNVLWYFVFSFIFSRFFYVIAEWRDFKFIFSEGILKFFLMSDYNFSLMGGVLGFMLVLLFQIQRYKLSARKYIDAVVLAFFFAAIVGFLGAFFGGQIYGRPTDLFFGITYTSSASNNPYTTPTFPLAIVYSIVSFILFTALYITRLFVKIEGLVGYVGLAIFASVLLIAERYNGSTDIFRSYFLLDLNQIGAVVLIILSARWLYRIHRLSQ